MEQKIILYIEDNVHNRRIVRKILESQGYTLLEAGDGESGLMMIRRLKPPLVLLDISLPGMDGLELLAQVRADDRLRHIPVIALTASAMRGDRERFLAAGCDDYISKPVQVAELLEKVAAHYPSNHAATKTNDQPASQPPRRATKTILIIEDNPDSARLALRALKPYGYRLLYAPDGESGLAMAAKEKPDLILLDLGLPDLEGQTLAALLRGIPGLAHVPLIAVTAWPPDTAVRMAKAYGCDGCISKPISPREFPSQIAAYLNAEERK